MLADNILFARTRISNYHLRTDASRDMALHPTLDLTPTMPSPACPSTGNVKSCDEPQQCISAD